MAKFVGTWERSKFENIEAFWEVTGIPADVQKAMQEEKDVVIIENEGDTWHITSRFKGHDDKATFKLGVRSEYCSLMGAKMEGIVKCAGETMEEEYVIGGIPSEVKRSIDGDNMMLVDCHRSGVSAKVWYEKK